MNEFILSKIAEQFRDRINSTAGSVANEMSAAHVAAGNTCCPIIIIVAGLCPAPFRLGRRPNPYIRPPAL